MSYKETEETLKRLLNKLESLEAEFLVERDVYKEAFKKDLAAARNVVKKLNEGNWYFDMDGLKKIVVTHKNDKGLYEGNAIGGSGGWCEIAPDRKLLPFKELKKKLVRCMLDCIQNTETVPQLEYLRDVTLRDAETAENKITESFYEELFDTLNPNYESYHALEDMWNKLRPTVSNYQEKALDLSKQAANEWFAEGLIRKGDLFNTLSFEDPIKVEKIKNGIIYTDAGGRWEIDNLHPSVIEHVWEINHPQFKVDDLIKPLDSIADWRLTQ